MSGEDPAATQPPPEPDRRPAGAMLAADVAGGVASSAFAVFIAAAALPVFGRVDGLPGWVQPVLIVLLVLGCGLAVVVVPVTRHRTLRYAVRPEEIDLVRGWFVRTRTVIPMARVQHVETDRGPIETLLGIATVKIHTAAGTHAVPGLPDAAAAALRTEIARRARVVDEV